MFLNVGPPPACSNDEIDVFSRFQQCTNIRNKRRKKTIKNSTGKKEAGSRYKGVPRPPVQLHEEGVQVHGIQNSQTETGKQINNK